MVSPDSKKIYRIENLDRISQLPESMILNILSRLPLKDSARASILSKTWKTFCGLYPILYFDHNLFALQSMVSAKDGGGEPDIDQIRDMFMDDVDCQLSRAMQLDSPIRKLALAVATNCFSSFLRIDKWMELVRQINVEDLCITVDFMLEAHIYRPSIGYEFPPSVLASKGLRSAHVQGCKLGCETLVDYPIKKFFSLQRLCLSYVFMDEHALGSLIRCCQGIETLVLDNCFVEIKYLTLSKFPKLKKVVISLKSGKFDIVDIEGTNLECFRCYAETQLLTCPVACAGIRELSLAWGTRIHDSYLFEDLTATFPLLEEGEIYLHETNTPTLKAASNVIRKLTFCSYASFCVKNVHIDCPSLTLLQCWTKDLLELYVDCPKLRIFNYCGTTLPLHVFCSPMANLEESRCNITLCQAYDTLWLVKLRAFLILVIGNATNVKLTFTLPMASFKPEQVDAIEVSPRYNVHLTLVLASDNMQNVATLMDGLLFVIRPTTLTVSCEAYNVVKYLCEKLLKKQEENITDEQLTTPCWMHQLEDFHVECPLDVPVSKNNLAALPEQCRTFIAEQIRFKFNWRFN